MKATLHVSRTMLLEILLTVVNDVWWFPERGKDDFNIFRQLRRHIEVLCGVGLKAIESWWLISLQLLSYIPRSYIHLHICQLVERRRCIGRDWNCRCSKGPRRVRSRKPYRRIYNRAYLFSSLVLFVQGGLYHGHNVYLSWNLGRPKQERRVSANIYNRY